MLDDLVAAGKLRYYGVSVKSPEEGLKAMDYPNLQSVQIIFNMFRHRPAELFFAEAKRRRVGILAGCRWLPACLLGRCGPIRRSKRPTIANSIAMAKNSMWVKHFQASTMRPGLKAVEELKAVCPPGWTLTQFALRWILMHDAVTCAIPGAKRPQAGGGELCGGRFAGDFGRGDGCG